MTLQDELNRSPLAMTETNKWHIVSSSPCPQQDLGV